MHMASGPRRLSVPATVIEHMSRILKMAPLREPWGQFCEKKTESVVETPAASAVARRQNDFEVMLSFVSLVKVTIVSIIRKSPNHPESL